MPNKTPLQISLYSFLLLQNHTAKIETECTHQFFSVENQFTLLDITLAFIINLSAFVGFINDQLYGPFITSQFNLRLCM